MQPRPSKPQTPFLDHNPPNPPNPQGAGGDDLHRRKREFFVDNLLVQIHFIIVMIRWTGLVPWEFEFPFPGSLTSTFLVGAGGDDLHGRKAL